VVLPRPRGDLHAVSDVEFLLDATDVGGVHRSTRRRECSSKNLLSAWSIQSRPRELVDLHPPADSRPVNRQELLREVYAADNPSDATIRLEAFYAHASWAGVPELSRLAKTVRAWEAEIMSFHVTGASTGPVEAQNLVTERLRRIGHGFRNFANYRLRLLLHSGVEWDDRPVARIRGRQPRLVA